MKVLLGFREQLQKLYSTFGFYIRKLLQFVIALVIFQSIGKQIGYMPILTSSTILAGLALICMLLPVSWTVFMACALILGHMYKVSLIVMGMTAVVLLLLYIFYLRFATMYSWVVLITAIACSMKLGFAIPVILALTEAPVAAFAAGVGIFMYYFLQFLSEYAATATSSSGLTDMITQATSFIKSAFGNKEMWLLIAVFVIVTFVIYFIRRIRLPYAWGISIAAGVAACFLSNTILGARLGTTLPAGTVTGGIVVMIITGILMILLLHTVDYSETRKVQFEDDEYYYYVTAVPKLSIAAPHKEVKTFGGRSKEVNEPVSDDDIEYEQDADEEYVEYDQDYEEFDESYEDDYESYEDDDMQIYEERN